MSKVYSFRLSDDNPREAEAKHVIETWMEVGYSLRQTIVDALIYYNQYNTKSREVDPIIEKLQYLLLSLEESIPKDRRRSVLTTSFLDGIKQSAKSGLRQD